MPHDLFGDVVRPSVKLGSRAWYTVPLSIAAHVALAAVIIVVPLMATDTLPSPSRVLATFVATSPPPPPPPVAPAPARRDNAQTTSDPTVAPTDPPSKIVDEVAPPAPPTTGVGIEGGLPVEFGTPGGTGLSVVPAPPPPVPVITRPLPVGGDIKPPTKIKDVRPIDPQIAQANRVQGLVIIEATISADGKVTNARILKSVPLLDQAALDAVLQWRFTTPRLNGVPIPVLMTVSVDFRLQ